MKTRVKKILTALKSAAKAWVAKDPFRESAVIAYYAIFALPGLLVLVIGLAGYFFGREVVDSHVADQISSMLGSTTAEQVQNMVEKASEKKNSLWTTIIGIVTIFIGATGVFAEFQKSLNTIWEVKADTHKSGLWKFIRARLFSFGLIVSIAFILMVSLLVSALLATFASWLTTHFSASFHTTLQVLNFAFSFLVEVFLFALLFKFLPDAKIKWRYVWIGSFVTGFLFEIGKFALGLYFGNANPGAWYGAAGSIILILLWVSYSCMLVFFGAEFTHAYAKLYSGVTIQPTDIAVRDVSPTHK